jgi:hypothetical protein
MDKRQWERAFQYETNMSIIVKKIKMKYNKADYYNALLHSYQIILL